MLWISTFCLQESPLEIALEKLGTLTRGIEINDQAQHKIPSTDLLESFPYKYSINVPNLDLNPASILEPVRQATILSIKERFDLAAEIGADVIIRPGYVSVKNEIPAAKKQFAKSMQDLIKYADECSIMFYVQNMGKWSNYLLRTPSDLNILGPIPLALDVGSAHINGCLPMFLNEIGSKYLYLYDSTGTNTSRHLEVGKGSIDFTDISRFMHDNVSKGVIRVSSYRAAYNSIKMLRNFGIG